MKKWNVSIFFFISTCNDKTDNIERLREKNGSYHLLFLRLSQQNIAQLFLVKRWEMLNVRGIRVESSLTFIPKAQKYKSSCCPGQDPLERVLPWNVWTNLSGVVGGKCIKPGDRMWQNVTCFSRTFLLSSDILLTTLFILYYYIILYTTVTVSFWMACSCNLIHFALENR